MEYINDNIDTNEDLYKYNILTISGFNIDIYITKYLAEFDFNAMIRFD